MAKNPTVEERIEKQKQEVLRILKENCGLVATTCKAAGIDRSTFYDWKRSDPAFAEEVESINELQKDFGESLILKKMKEGDTTMIIFYAKTKMKDRGFVERRELTGADGTQLVQHKSVDTSKLTDEQRAALLTIGEQVLNDTEH